MKLFRCVFLGLGSAAVVLAIAGLVGTSLPELASHVSGELGDRAGLGVVLVGALLAGILGGAIGAGQSRRVFGGSDSAALWFAGLAGPALLASIVVLLFFADDPVGSVPLSVTVALLGGAVLGTASGHQEVRYDRRGRGPRESAGRAAPLRATASSADGDRSEAPVSVHPSHGNDVDQGTGQPSDGSETAGR